jgi:hypothetical protein
MGQLWNPKVRPNLPDRAEAKDVADKFLKANALLPNRDANINVVFSHHSETGGGEDTPGGVAKRLLDRQVNYKIEIKIRGPEGKERTLPVVGGGGKFQVSIGDHGSVIGFDGGWREIGGIESQEEIKPEATVFAEFKQKVGTVQVKNIRTELAYYAAPPFQEQSLLAPVWLVHAEIQVGTETVPMSIQVIAATKYGPIIEQAPSAKARDSNETPPPPGKWDEQPTKRHKGEPAHHCGTAWTGLSQGSVVSSINAQGFVDQCQAAGWGVRFNWGDLNAWERDFRANDDSYVDNVDLVFYKGHASQNGWVLNNPDDTFLHYSEVGGAVDLYGNTDLEWLVIDACGPLESTHFTTNTTNAFDRWRNIFDGLHVLLGYGAATIDEPVAGGRFMELARGGWNVIDAWFRTAQETQPSLNGESAPYGPTIYVVAMYAHKGDYCARSEHLWGMGGNPCSDVPAGVTQKRYMIWTST